MSDVESPLVSAGASASGIGAEPSPIKIAGADEFTELAPLTALRAPASIKAARVAMSVFFMFHKLLRYEVFCIVKVGMVVTVLAEAKPGRCAKSVLLRTFSLQLLAALAGPDIFAPSLALYGYALKF
jgi:hypothetical protein